MSDRLELETRCRVCRRTWIPLHSDYVRGPRYWQRCPRCRDRDMRHDGTRSDTTPEDAMPNYPKPATEAPFDLEDMTHLYAGDGYVPIVAKSRRTVTVDYYGRRLDLKRRDLERAGVASVHGVRFSVTRYQLPDRAA